MLLRRIQRPRLTAAATQSRASATPRHVSLQLAHAHAHMPLRLELQARFARQQPQHRLLWGRAADLMSWMGLKSDTDKSSKSDATAAAMAASKDSNAKNRTVDADTHTVAAVQSDAVDSSSSERSTAPPLATTITTSNGIKVTVDARSVRDVKRAMLAFRHHVRVSTSNTELLASWQRMRTREPFCLVDGAVVAPCDVAVSTNAIDTNDADDSSDGAVVLQLLPLATFVELTARVQPLAIGNRVSFAGATPAHARVVFVSEKLVLRQLLPRIASCKHSDTAVLRDAQALFDEYERERGALIAASGQPGSHNLDYPEPPPTPDQIDEWTRLSRDTYAASIELLVALGDHARVVTFFDDAAHRRTFLGSTQTLRQALKACAAQHRGDLARVLVDDFTHHFPWLVLGKHAYQAAIQACLRSDDRVKTHAQLDNALHVYDRMTRDAGYIVYPNLWSTLFNTSIYLARHDDALAVFRTYASQCIAPFERRFTQTLRTACKLEQYDTAVAMVHVWVALERDAAVSASTSTTGTTGSILENQHVRAQRAVASRRERECFNKILWEMLKGAPTFAQLGDVLTAMQARSAPAGAQIIRLLVARYLATEAPVSASNKSEAETMTESMDRVTQLLALWDAVPRVIERNGFVAHLVIEHCLAAGWERECAHVIDYAIAHRIDLPMGSIVKILEHYELRGDLDAVAALGTKLLTELDDAARARLSASFFEVLLMSYLRQQQFADVLTLERELKLTARFPKSQVLSTIVKDAANA